MGCGGDRVVNERKKWGFLFPGQGSQFVGMGKELYNNSRSAKLVFDIANKELDRDITELCFEGPEKELSTTKNSQPAIFTVSIATLNAVVEKQRSFSEPRFFKAEELSEIADVVMGLSLGEPTALVASGAISFSDGLKFVAKRGEFMQEASQDNPGKMASILGLEADKVEEICNGLGDCVIANLNCPGQVVISGRSDKVELASELAKNNGAKRAIPLKVSGAFHSFLMKDAQKKLEEVLEDIEVQEPLIDFISNINAQKVSDPEKIKKNLADQLTNRTLWQACVEAAIAEGCNEFLETGPGKVLKGLARKIDRSVKVRTLQSKEDVEALEI